MSYEVKYRLEFVDEYDRQVRVDIEQDGYTGETISERVGEGFSPLHISIQNQGDPKFETIKATEIELSIFSDNFELEEISEASDTEFLMKVYEAPTENGDLSLKHIGYVIPEIYTEPYVVEPYPVTIRAASIGILNNIRYVTDVYGEFFTGEATLMTILTRCLNKLGYELDIWDSINTYEDRILYFDTSPLEEIKIDQAAFLFEENDREKAKTCMEVIEQILKPFVVNFFMDYGRWVIIPMELRGTNREVRIFDYQETSQSTEIYNPLNENYDWIDQDQILEFLPIARDVDSVHEHGEPQNIVRNYQFEDDFISVSKATGEIRYPSEWVLNDSDDFLTQADSSGDIYAGIKETAVDKGGDSKETRTLRFLIFRFDLPNKQNLSQLKRSTTAVFMLSALINDGAYIEQAGTKIIQAGEDRVRFSIDYSGAVYVESGDINFADLKVPDNTIDHKFQVQLGSKYLDSDGSWTDTETDIILTDLGDGNPGYSDINLSGVATRLRTFDIISDPIEESGTPVFRIYKPVSENEDSAVLPTYAAVAYSTFSVELYPGGLPPDGETLYFTERDVETYSDDFEYTLESGDGPTNFHVSSFLIDTEYGNNLKTENWVRGNLEGGLSEIAINAIFLEYDTKSNLIRGTQKVKGLFDRWFIEYGKGYTVLAGTYDQRLCRFNGEMVQILNAEVDVCGDELEPGPNFAVETNPGPHTDFDDELIYYIYNGASDDREVRKATANQANGVVTDATYALPDSLSLTNSAVHVLRNGNVLVTAENGVLGGGQFDMWLIDSETNEITTKTFSLDGSNSANYAYIDYDDSIYITIKTPSKDLHVRKYSPDLQTLIWESPIPNDVNPDRWFHYSGNVTKNHVVVQMGSFFADNDIVHIYDKETGEIVNTIARSYRVGTVNGGAIRNFENGNFIIVEPRSTSTGVDNVYLYDENASLISSTEITDFDPNSGRTFDVIDNTHFVVKDGGSNQLKYFDTLWNLIWTSPSLNPSGNTKKMGRTTDPYVILVSSDTQKLVKVDLTNETITTLSKTGALLEDQAANRAFGMKVENWQVQSSVDTGTPTITNVVLTADPETATVPFSSLIEFGADNTGDADITLPLTIDGEVEFELDIPAGGSASFSISRGFPNPGSFEVGFGGGSLTITANGNDVTGDYEGWIDVESAAQDDTTGAAPTTFFDIIGSPSQSSDSCAGSGTNRTFTKWKTTDYCFDLPDNTKAIIATVFTSHFNNNVPGLSATNTGLSPSGHPRVEVESDTVGEDDNGEDIILLVPSAIEQDGVVFHKYTRTLSGGVDEVIISEQIDILIGGSVFATTSAITALETAGSIAQKIYDACVAVGSGTYTFAKNETRVLVGSTAGEETLDLDIKNAGFSYSTQNIVEV